MFSKDWIQEAIALGLAGLSGLILVLRLAGVGLRRKPKAAPVQLGARLARGLKHRRR